MPLLLVEDDVMVGSAERALEVTLREAFDVAIIDIGLPGMDGLVLTQRLRKAPDDLPVLLTASLCGRCRPPVAHAAGRPAGGTVTLRCAHTPDDGPGVPPQERVRVHRSQLVVDSGRDNKGTRIRLIFPA